MGAGSWEAAPEAGEVEEEPSPSEPSELDLMAIAQGVARQAETDKNCKGRETTTGETCPLGM